MEQSLEKLNEKNEVDWTNYLDKDVITGKPITGKRFFKFKEEINSLRAITEKFLNSTMNDIAQGLPSVTAEKTTKKRDILFDEVKI